MAEGMKGVYVVGRRRTGRPRRGWGGAGGLGGRGPVRAHELPGDGDNTLVEGGTERLEERRAQVCDAESACITRSCGRGDIPMAEAAQPIHLSRVWP